MKSKFLIAALLLVAATAHSQTANLSCDSSTMRKDTVRGYMVWIDTSIARAKVHPYVGDNNVNNWISTSTQVQTDSTAYAVRDICKLMYRGTNGAPNAYTGQEGVNSITYYGNGLPGTKKKAVLDDWIIKFVIYKPKK
jgi:hypothetical protein